MVLARWQANALDEDGNVLDTALVTVRREVVGLPLATLFSDRDGLVALGNPFWIADGYIAFHAVGGAYHVTVVSGSFSRTWRYVAVGLAQETDGGGDVTGPAASTDNAVARFDGTSGGILKDSGVTVDDDNNIAWSGNITQTRIGGLWTDAPNFRPTPIEGVNIARFERVFIGAACDNTGVKIASGSTDWLEDLASFTTANAELAVVAQSGRHAIVCGVRSSDNDASPSNCIALSVYTDNDNATFSQGGWGMYIEAWRRPGQGFTTCYEVDINNFGNVVDMDPYSASFASTTSAFWCASGGEETPSPNDASVGIAFINNNAAFRKGITFDQTSITIDGATGTGCAIAMALNHRLEWFSAAGVRGMGMWSTSKGVLHIGSFDISTETFDIEVGSGRSGNGACIIDLHSAAGADFEARLIRGSGANGNLGISNLGTGAIQIDAANASGVVQLLVNSAEAFRADGSGLNLATGKVARVNGVQVLTSRRTGWTAATGTATRTAFATHTAQTISNPPTQTQVQNIDNSLVAASQRLKALIDDLITHGAIGA